MTALSLTRTAGADYLQVETSPFVAERVLSAEVEVFLCAVGHKEVPLAAVDHVKPLEVEARMARR